MTMVLRQLVSMTHPASPVDLYGVSALRKHAGACFLVLNVVVRVSPLVVVERNAGLCSVATKVELQNS
jgi:hypothetical protein